MSVYRKNHYYVNMDGNVCVKWNCDDDRAQILQWPTSADRTKPMYSPETVALLMNAAFEHGVAHNRECVRHVLGLR